MKSWVGKRGVVLGAKSLAPSQAIKKHDETLQFFMIEPKSDDSRMQCHKVWHMAKSTKVCGLVVRYLQTSQNKLELRKKCQLQLAEVELHKLQLPPALADRLTKAVQLKL